ncbi:MAG: PA2169 family four-helix-bundle protein [Burkholderiales bacterium]
MSHDIDPSARAGAGAASGATPKRADSGAETRIDAQAEEAHWRGRFESEPYWVPGREWKDYHPAYELGWRRRAQSDADFDAHEADLAREWEQRRGASPLDWPAARSASRAAWNRADSIYYEQARQVGRDEAFAFIEPQGDAAAATARGSLPTTSSTTTGPVDRAMSHDEVVDVLNHLLENARDGERGFKVCADEIEGNNELKRVFVQRADLYREQGRELTPLVAQYRGTPADGGSVRGALQRAWMHLKGAVGADDASSMLGECERAEDASVARYRSALQHPLPADVRAVVERQSVAARQSHDIFLELRDGADSSS